MVSPRNKVLLNFAGQFPKRKNTSEGIIAAEASRNVRWLSYLGHQCALSGVRRVLVVGGSSALHDSLRHFSEGHALEIRFLTQETQNNEGRLRGRVEGCDLVILGSGGPAIEALNRPYVTMARQLRKLLIKPANVGSEKAFTPRTLALAAVNVLARAEVLSPI